MQRYATPPAANGHSNRPARPTIKDVARHAGVAAGTVSHALSGRRHVSAATVERIQAAINQLDYRPNALAQAMITGRSQALGLVLPDIVNPFFAHVARGAQDLARERGYSVILCNSDLRPDSELRDIETLLAHQVDGIVFIPGSTSAYDTLERLARSGSPYVLMDEALSGPDSPGVFSDNEEGGYIAGQHLIDVGARSVVFIGGPPELPTVQEKEAGLCRALAEHGIEPVGARYGQYRTDAGFELVSGLVETGTRFDGLFAADDLLALGANQALQKAGLRVPEDVAVCGFDGMPGSELWTPALTTVAQHIHELGATAVRLLLDLIEGRISVVPRVVVSVELVVRGSTIGHKASSQP